VLGLCALTVACGCERRALGPFECQELGARVLGVTDSRALADPELKQALDTFTVECLTTPFDRTLARCVEETGRARACLADMALRRPEIQKATP
jgi:hypothetical protein